MGDINANVAGPGSSSFQITSSPWTAIFALIGFLFLGSKLISFLRLIFSLFVFPGIPVRSCSLQPYCSSVMVSQYLADWYPTASYLWAPFQLGRRNRCFGWHWKRIRRTALSARLQHTPHLPHRIQTPSPCRDHSIQVSPPQCHQNTCYGLRIQQ